MSALLTTVAPFDASAQSVPSVADPSRSAPQTDTLKPQIENLKAPQQRPRSSVTLADIAAKKKYLMTDLAISGMTVYDIDDLKKKYWSDMGTTVSLKYIYEIALALQQRYVDDGFTLTKVSVPEQKKDGIIRIDVIEGYVAEVEIKGTIRPSFVVDDLIKQIKAMHPLNVRKLERLMLVMNDMPGVKMGSILATPKGKNYAPGAVRLVLEETMLPRISGNWALNNYGSRYSGPLQAVGSASIAHVGMNYSNLSVVSTLARPLSELMYGRVGYDVPLFGASGTKLEFSVTAAHNEPGEDLKDLEVEGTSRQASVGISYPIIRQRDKTWRVDTGLSIENSRTDLLGDRLYDDRVRILAVGSSYAFSDRYNGYNAVNVKLAHGLDILGGRKTGSVDLSRELGQSDFTKIQGTLGRQQALPKNFEAYFAVDGQFTNDPLLSGQEFGFGGTQFGRGYDPSEVTGDKGVATTLELRYNTLLQKQKIILQPYVFYDVARVWNIDPGAREKISAASSGFGMRANTISNWKSEINFAFPLTRPADNPPKYSTDKGVRVLFSVGSSF